MPTLKQAINAFCLSLLSYYVPLRGPSVHLMWCRGDSFGFNDFLQFPLGNDW